MDGPGQMSFCRIIHIVLMEKRNEGGKNREGAGERILA